MSNSTSRAFHGINNINPRPELKNSFQERVYIPISDPNRFLPIENGKRGETMVNKTIEEWMKENGYDKEVVYEEKSFLQKIKEFILNFKPYF